MSTTITVHKLDHRGREVVQYQGRLLRRSPQEVTLEARFDHQDAALEGFTLRRGDRLVETFYRQCWYNVFAVFDGQTGDFKGYYCNITRPARFEGDHIYAEDLALDLLVLPDGTWRVLDEEEFESLELDPHERAAARQALAELAKRAAQGAPPLSLYRTPGPG
jgi:predicted RNA-binding protein associated with RNAse of E/G family